MPADNPANYPPASVDASGFATRLTVQAAQALIKERVPMRNSGSEIVSLTEARGRVLAQEACSQVAIPGFDHAAMDGIALRYEDWKAAGPSGLRRERSVFAGDQATPGVARGTCVGIMTGAPVPEGADTVVPRELLDEADGQVRVRGDVRPGQHIRKRGEDIGPGDTLFSAGRRLTSADVGLLASIGFDRVPVRKRPRLVFFSTGNELREPGSDLAFGQLYDSNQFSIGGIAEQLGCEVERWKAVEDNPDALAAAMGQAAEHADVVVTSGGVSAGDADYVTQTIAKLGQIHFWKVLMKPGMPLVFGDIGGTPCFGLPGNPVSGVATFLQLVRYGVLHLAGEPASAPLRLQAESRMGFTKRHSREEFIRASLSWDEAGQCVVYSVGSQSSGRLHSMSLANCFVVLPAKPLELVPGDFVSVEPFSGYFPV